MGQYGDIIAYEYSTDLYCPNCIVGLVCEGGDREPVPVPMMAAEEALDYLADQWGIDRYDESCFDSEEFPKVVLDDPFDGSGDENWQGFRCGCCNSELDN